MNRAVLLTVNTNYKSAELAYPLRQSETENLFIIDGFQDTDYMNTVYELVPELKTFQRGNLRSKEFPCLKRVGLLGQEKHRGMYTIPEIRALGVMVGDDRISHDRVRQNPEVQTHGNVRSDLAGKAVKQSG